MERLIDSIHHLFQFLIERKQRKGATPISIVFS